MNNFVIGTILNVHYIFNVQFKCPITFESNENEYFIRSLLLRISTITDRMCQYCVNAAAACVNENNEFLAQK